MTYEQKDNSMILFTNDKKDKPTAPDFKGNATIEGTQYWAAAWKKQGTKCAEFITVSLTKKEKKIESPVCEPDEPEDIRF